MSGVNKLLETEEMIQNRMQCRKIREWNIGKTKKMLQRASLTTSTKCGQVLILDHPTWMVYGKLEGKYLFKISRINYTC